MYRLPSMDRPWTYGDVELYQRYCDAQARDNFMMYRRMIRPSMKVGWFVEDVARELQRFYNDLIAGKRPVLVLSAPPQHGKSWSVTDFIGWVSGKNPKLNTIYASYSEDLGVKCNSTLQRVMDLPVYQRLFPNTVLPDRTSKTFQRNSYLLEFEGPVVGETGSFRNTTVEGQINGMGLDLGVLDDPIKGRAEASSLLKRDKVWGWLTDDFFSRFSETAGLLMIMTRWHLDDPAGRFLEQYPQARLLRYPALAERNEAHRRKGEPLFAELKSKTFLMERKKLLTQAGFSSLYQQNPIVVGGDLFPVALIEVLPAMPSEDQIMNSVRYWDKAGTKDGNGARTAGVLMHQLASKRFVISDVVSGRWSALERERRILQCAQLDNLARPTEVWVEQEPGSGGKESAQSSILNLAGFAAYADRVTGSKETRAEPFAAQVQGGNISLVLGEWNKGFLDEMETFPNGRLKDQIDAAGGAFSKLTVRDNDYDRSLSWVDGVDVE